MDSAGWTIDDFAAASAQLKPALDVPAGSHLLTPPPSPRGRVVKPNINHVVGVTPPTLPLGGRVAKPCEGGRPPGRHVREHRRRLDISVDARPPGRHTSNFEFTFQLGWKACKLVSAEQGLPDCLSPKASLRQAYAAGWIDDETIWLEMLDARNRMAHTYDAGRALRIYESLPQYCAALDKLLATPQTLAAE